MNKYIVACVGLLLVGCVSTGRRISPAAVDKIQEGVSTKADVVRLLGAPESTTSPGDGTEILSYHHSRTKGKVQNYIPYVNIFSSGYDTEMQYVSITIGQDGIVQRVSETRSQSESNMGVLGKD